MFSFRLSVKKWCFSACPKRSISWLAPFTRTQQIRSWCVHTHAGSSRTLTGDLLGLSEENMLRSLQRWLFWSREQIPHRLLRCEGPFPATEPIPSLWKASSQCHWTAFKWQSRKKQEQKCGFLCERGFKKVVQEHRCNIMISEGQTLKDQRSRLEWAFLAPLPPKDA